MLDNDLGSFRRIEEHDFFQATPHKAQLSKEVSSLIVKAVQNAMQPDDLDSLRRAGIDFTPELFSGTSDFCEMESTK
jgi:hypothetical protein